MVSFQLIRMNNFSPRPLPADLEAYKLIWTTNVLGTLLCYKYAARQMVKQGSGGRIVGKDFSSDKPMDSD
jgi:NAD(P)-dependent dehydrogenase (short-subunit alcohol dehydrogenase family)